MDNQNINYDLLFQKMKEDHDFMYQEIYTFNSYNHKDGELKDKVVIDIGANTGYFSIFAIMNGAKKVYAFEPNPVNFKKLVERVKNFNNIFPINKAIHAPGIKKCYMINEDVRSEVRIDGEREGSVDCISLKEVLDDIPETVVLKTDCEGSEYDFFFPCSKETLQKIEIIYSEFHNGLHPDKNYNVDMLTDFIVKNGFEHIKYKAPWNTGTWVNGDFIPNTGGLGENGTDNCYRKFIKTKESIIKPKYSIVIPTYNHLEDALKPCLESIIRNTDLSDIEVIVVANGCIDGTKDYVESLGNPFKLIWIDEAAGYSRATNAGIKVAQGEYIILFNNDNVLLDFQSKNEWISILEKPFDQKSVGLTGPYLGNYFDHYPFLIFFCVMIKREVFDNIGLLDEAFGVGGGEDTDFCIKADRAGYKVLQAPEDRAGFFTDENAAYGLYPLWHKNGLTRKSLINFQETITTNEKILEDRYVNDSLNFSTRKNILHKTIEELDLGIYHELYIVDVYRMREEDLKDKIIIDIGSNHGLFSFRGFELGAKKAYCFEPQVEIYNELLRFSNVLFGMMKMKSKIVPYNLAVLDGSVSEVRMGNFGVSSNIYEGSGLSSTKCISLEEAMSYVEEKDSEMVLKLDCEGSEFEIILNSPPELLQRFSFLYVEIHDNINPKFIGKSKELISYLESLGFVFESQGPLMGEWLSDGNFIPAPITCGRFKNNNVKKYANNSKITIGYIDYDQDSFNTYLKPSIEKLSMDKYDIISSSNKNCIAKGYNEIIDKSKNQYILLVHQDVSFCPDLLSCIHDSISKVPDFGAMGIVGFDFNNNTIWGESNKIQEVERLDGCCILINKNNGLKFDEKTFDDLHMYSEDYCLQCIRNRGLKCYTFAYKYWKEEMTANYMRHHGVTYKKHGNKMWGKYDEYNMKLQNKWNPVKPKYSIVIPTYNHLEDALKPCLESIIKTTNLSDVEVIIVANGCTDGTKDYVESLGNPFKLVWMDDAAGYPRATNAGIKASQGEYVILLNNDVLLLDGSWINTLYKPFETIENLGATGPLLITDEYINDSVLMFFCVMIKREVFDRIGLLDESFSPGGCEDLDFMMRMKLLGITYVQVPNSDIINETAIMNSVAVNVGHFPIVHEGSKTFMHVKNYREEIVKRNGLVILKKYNKNIRLNLNPDIKLSKQYVSVGPRESSAHIIMNPFDLEFDKGTISEINAFDILNNLSEEQSNAIIEKWSLLLKDDGKIEIDSNKIGHVTIYKKLNLNYLKHRSPGSFDEIFNVDVYGMKEEDLKDKVVIDVGGFNGLFSIRAIELGAKRCYCFEPQIDNYNILIDLVKDRNILPYNLAVFDESIKEVKMSSTGMSSNIWDISDIHSTKCISLEEAVSYVEEKDSEMVLKLDCEGSEFEIILNSPPELLRRFSFLYVEIHGAMNPKHMGEKHNLVSYIEALGFVQEFEGPQPGWWSFDGVFTPNDVRCIKYRNKVVKKAPELSSSNSVSIVGSSLINKSKPKVYDCFCFFNELDLLEIRLNELDSYVDVFVISEMVVTHSGVPKPLYFEENKIRFEKFLHKIHYIKVTEYPIHPDPWIIEHFQRDCLAQGLRDCNDDDIIIISDLDEIPRGSKIKEYRAGNGVQYFEQNLYNYFLNADGGIDKLDKGVFSKIVSYGEFKNMRTTITGIRYHKCLESDKILNGGWHFRWTGGAENIVKKLESWAHQEFNTPEYKDLSKIESSLSTCSDAFSKDEKKLKIVDIDSSFPEFIVNNKNKFRYMIKDTVTKSKIYDCFMFFNELDLLEIRLNELDTVVDKFVLVEARQTHQGKFKPLYFDDNKGRFSKFLHKITHIIVDFPFDKMTSWERDSFQRNQISKGLKDCENDDIIILSDIDEIPKSSVIKEYNTSMGTASLETKLFYYKLNCDCNQKWNLSCIFPYFKLKGKDLQSFRNQNNEINTVIKDAGWHFSYLGDKDHIVNKIESFAHIEYNNEYIKSDQNILNAINNNVDLFGRNSSIKTIEVDDSFPFFVRENMEYFNGKNLIKDTL